MEFGKQKLSPGSDLDLAVIGEKDGELCQRLYDLKQASSYSTSTDILLYSSLEEIVTKSKVIYHQVEREIVNKGVPIYVASLEYKIRETISI